MLIFYDFIQVYVFTTNHHLKLSKSKDLYLNFLLSSLYTSWGVIIDVKPNQPENFKFPKRSFGQKNPELRAFILSGLPRDRGCIMMMYLFIFFRQFLLYTP